MDQPLVLTEDEAMELLAFLVTAARTQVDEAPEYGPMRLVMAAQHFIEAIRARVSQPTREFLETALTRLPELATPMSAPDRYIPQLDALCASLARYLATRYGVEPS